jgi:hypothetical protein
LKLQGLQKENHYFHHTKKNKKICSSPNMCLILFTNIINKGTGIGYLSGVPASLSLP